MMEIINKIKNRLTKPIRNAVQNKYFRMHTMLDEELRIKSRYSKILIPRSAKLYQIGYHVKNIEEHRPESDKIKIVFICQFHAAWNACMSTFKACVDDPAFDVTLLALPEKVMNKGKSKNVSDITQEMYGEENVAYEYCKSFYPDTINGYNTETEEWFDLKGLAPDYVVISRSNQNYLPEQYRSNYLSTYTKVIHIPYAYCKMYWDSRAVYRENLTDFTYAVFTENELYRDTLRRVYYDYLKADWKKIEFFGYPRFDLYPVVQEDDVKEKKTTVLWLPRWVTASRLEASTFFKYKDVLINYFLKHPEYKLICRPHPKMFGNFIATGEMSEKEVAEFKKLFEEKDNFHLDEYSDYLPSFDEADIFISDTTSLLVEEYITGKPIIFCGTMSRFDNDAKNWAQHLYAVNNKTQLIKQLDKLFKGEDPKRNDRLEYAKTSMKHDGQSGKRIAEFLKDDFRQAQERSKSGVK